MAMTVNGRILLPDHAPGECEDEYAAGALTDEEGRPTIDTLRRALVRVDLGIRDQPDDTLLLFNALEELGARRAAMEVRD